METKKEKFIAAFDRLVMLFEKIITIILTIIISFIVLVALARIFSQTYKLVTFDNFLNYPYTFESYTDIFGKIMTLLISIEFMKSIVKVLKAHEIRVLIIDVVLIAALAICRKLIIYDYTHSDSLEVIALGVLLIALGVLHFLIKASKP